MNEPNTTLPQKRKCLPCPLMLVGGLVFYLIAFAWVSRVVHKVFNGAGLEYCCVIEGVRFNYISVFVLLCAVAVALLVAAIVQVRDWRIRRDFERKYGVKIPPSSTRPASSSDSNSGPSFHGVGYGDGD